ncbi:MAG TPA: PDZ domain-containing protein [Vicinamibacterales bacterium]|nr:PDZ domain-containing protein [Vicinamibacterales bacterium]
MRQTNRLSAFIILIALASAPTAAAQPQATQYQISFPAPEHHYAEVEVTFPAAPATLEARMSRSSPGRYAIHEYSKNVFDVRAFDGKGKALPIVRPNPYQWNVSGHDGTVRITYKIFGNHVDGTYLGIDATHAHMNIPATFMWARGFDLRPIRVTFTQPKGTNWKVATQLFPTSDPFTFTAPNFQYFMDSPTEMSDFGTRSFKVTNPDGREFTIVTAVHHDGPDSALDEYVAGAEKIVREQGAIFGEFPEFDTGTYTFLGDYVPWGGGDGMEHRNSTVVASPVSFKNPQTARQVLGTVSHEFFHAWNVERIRPKSLEPFNFEEANMSGELWIAEGFTQYYGGLVMGRAGLRPAEQTLLGLANGALGVAAHPARQFRSAVEMSQHAPYSDAARSVDETNFSYAFISYYSYGSALALAMDLELRIRSSGKVSLDDYMRAMWTKHGKPGGAQPGLVAKPYTLQDARDRLAEISGDRKFADDFFSRFVEGREAPDYAKLLAPAGIVVQRRSPETGWTGLQMDRNDGTKVGGLVAFGTPAFAAGIEGGDVITSIGGAAFTNLAQALKNRKPGEKLAVEFRRPSGEVVKSTVTLGQDPAWRAATIESTGGTLTPEQKAFRDSWVGSKVK